MDDHFLFYADPEHIRNNVVHFPEEEVRHIVKVLRKKPGDRVQVTDGSGKRMDVRLMEIEKKRVTGEIVATEVEPAEPERILAMGLVRKRERLEFAIEKAVELGATHIILVHSDHSEKMSIKAPRVDNIIISAIKQSQRCYLPKWETRNSFGEVLEAYGKDRRVLVAHPRDSPVSENHAKDDPLLMMVGPEGGFSTEELEQAASAEAVFIRLAHTRLRTETAVCAVMAYTARML